MCPPDYGKRLSITILSLKPSYGDPTQKRTQLLRLGNGDLLVFYAGLRPVGFQDLERLYFIGYFTVASVERVVAIDPWPPTSFPHLSDNAHFRRSLPDEGLVVVHGQPKASKLLDRAIAISDEAQVATMEVEEKIGISGFLMRAAYGRWVPTDYIRNIVDWVVGHE
jgi:hypothetical protein